MYFNSNLDIGRSISINLCMRMPKYIHTKTLFRWLIAAQVYDFRYLQIFGRSANGQILDHSGTYHLMKLHGKSYRIDKFVLIVQITDYGPKSNNSYSQSHLNDYHVPLLQSDLSISIISQCNYFIIKLIVILVLHAIYVSLEKAHHRNYKAILLCSIK